MTIADRERTCRIMISSVRAIMIGNNGTIARVALPDSSIDPAVSMRYPSGRESIMGCSDVISAVETSGGCRLSATSPRTVMVGVRSRRRSRGSSILISTSPICDKGTRCPSLPTRVKSAIFAGSRRISPAARPMTCTARISSRTVVMGIPDSRNCSCRATAWELSPLACSRS